MPDELLVLGSASAIATANRFASAYALTVAGKLFLIDCGAPVSSLLYRYDLDPLEVDSIFLSHWHMDHVAELGPLLVQNRLLHRPCPLNIYGPKGTQGKIRRLLAASFMLMENMGYELNITNIKPGKRYQDGLIRFRFFKTEHLEETHYKTDFGEQAIACGLVINGPGWRIVYSGDLTSPTELAPHLGKCTLLVHEMAHVRPEAVADFAETTKIPCVLVSHLPPEFAEAPEKIVDAFAHRYSGQLIVAEDGLRVKL